MEILAYTMIIIGGIVIIIIISLIVRVNDLEVEVKKLKANKPKES